MRFHKIFIILCLVFIFYPNLIYSWFIDTHIQRPEFKAKIEKKTPLKEGTALASQTAQTVKFMFSNVDFGPTKYKTGDYTKATSK